MRYLSFADCQTEGRVAFNRSKNGSLVGLAGLPLSAAWKLALNLCPFKGEQIWLVIENPPATKPDKPGRGERMTEELNNRPATISNDEEAIAPDSSPATIAMLLDVLEREYVTLLTELSAHLHSPDAAADALHDTYVKLRSKPSVADVRQPRSYLYRMAINLALNNRRRDLRTIASASFELESLPDGMPDPERSALAFGEMEQMFSALHMLAPKSRAIFLARWRDEKTNDEIAATFGIHKRSVQKDLAQTELHLRAMLGRVKQG